MSGASFVKDLAVVLGVAAITSPITKKLNLPPILGYMVAGLLIGPYIPLPLFADQHRVETLSEFGVIFVMFAVGLEFRIKKFLEILPNSGVTALVEISGLAAVGLSIGYFLGWSSTQSIFLAGTLCISSTMVVIKTFEEYSVEPDSKSHILGTLVVQDIVAIILLTVFSTFAVSREIQVDLLAPTFAKLGSALFIVLVAGLFVVPRYIRHTVSLKSSEILVVVSVGICFALSLILEKMGFSVALGAFLAGILVSESGFGHKVDRQLQSLKDLFAAIFFVAIGMTVNPAVAIKNLHISLFISLAVISSQFFFVFLGGVLSGAGLKKSILGGIALGQIGEFSFIVAGIGISTGLVSPDFQAIVVTTGVVTSFITPLLWRNSDTIYTRISKVLPDRIRIAIGLYETWFHRLQKFAQQPNFSLAGITKKHIYSLIIDAVLIIALPPFMIGLIPLILERLDANSRALELTQTFLPLLLLLTLFPIIYGLIKNGAQIIAKLSDALFDLRFSSPEHQSVSRALFKGTLWSLLFLVVALPTLSAIRPFMNPYIYYIAIAFTTLLLAKKLWTSAGAIAVDFESGGKALVNVLERQTFSSEEKEEHAHTAASFSEYGIENLVPVKMLNESLCGKSFAEANIRGKTGATVVAILRDHQKILFPTHEEILLKDDILEIWGDESAKQKIRRLFEREESSQHEG